jgi:uncharacterized protein YbcI
MADIHQGQSVLQRLADEMVRAQKEFFGKGPEQARAYLLDDLCFIVLRGGLTTAELTMLKFGHPDLVRQFRQIFENEMTGRLIDMVEEVTGRSVATYQSQVMFDPHVIVEMFVFDEVAERGTREATAAGQLGADDAGDADPGLLEPPAHAGR